MHITWKSVMMDCQRIPLLPDVVLRVAPAEGPNVLYQVALAAIVTVTWENSHTDRQELVMSLSHCGTQCHS